ncbi:MAG: hypothetical protein ACRERD_18875 [Candidatus Binatia bacterium]
METREHLHHLIDALPDSALETASCLLIGLQQPVPSANTGKKEPPRVTDLAWTQRQTAETRARLASFEEDWNAPGMDGYDDL